MAKRKKESNLNHNQININKMQNHLDELQRQIMKYTRENKLLLGDYLPLDTELYDDNCYGTHKLRVVQIL